MPRHQPCWLCLPNFTDCFAFFPGARSFVFVGVLVLVWWVGVLVFVVVCLCVECHFISLGTVFGTEAL
jgi:hypothetical protein